MDYHGHALLLFTQEARSRLRAMRQKLVVGVPRAKYQKLTPRYVRGIYDSGQNIWLGFLCTKIFLERFFFLSGSLKGAGGGFFGGVIYLAPLDLGPSTLNLWPALM